jgi:hypothetical protein
LIAVANTKITELTQLTNPVSTDVLPIVDVGADVTKKISIADLLKNAAVGTAEAPGIAFDGRSRNGIYSPGADQVAISTNGTGRLFVDASGNVGVGTAAETGLLGGVRSFEITANTTARLILQATDSGGRKYGVFSSTDGQLSFYDYTAGSERIRLDSSGRLGVGTSVPVCPLNVVGNTFVTGGNYFADTSGGYFFGGFAGFGGGIYGADSGNTTRIDAPQTIALRINNSERARIDSSGRLLVGTSSARSISSAFLGGGGAIAELQVEGPALAMGSFTSNRNDDFGPYLALVKSRGTAAGSFALVSNGDGIGALSFNGTDGSAALVGAAISAFVDGTPGTNDMPGRLVFSTTADGASSPTERMRISNAGTTTLTSAASTAPFIANIGASEAARIDSSGRLLVGTSTSTTVDSGAAAKVQTDGYYAAAFLNKTADSFGPYVYFAKSRGGTTIVQNGDTLGGIAFNGCDGTDFETFGASIAAQVDGTPGAGDMPGRLVFSTTADGSASPTERMRISSGGDCCFGITSIPTGAANGVAIADGRVYTSRATTESTTHLNFYNTNGVVGNISTSGSTTTYNTSSDYRLKENVSAVTDGITRLQQLKPSRFNFIAAPGHTVDGFLAHEVQEVVPEAITGEKDAVDDEGNPIYQGIDQSKLVPLLTAALQESLAEIESLKARVTALEP